MRRSFSWGKLPSFHSSVKKKLQQQPVSENSTWKVFLVMLQFSKSRFIICSSGHLSQSQLCYKSIAILCIYSYSTMLYFPFIPTCKQISGRALQIGPKIVVESKHYAESCKYSSATVVYASVNQLQFCSIEMGINQPGSFKPELFPPSLQKRRKKRNVE